MSGWPDIGKLGREVDVAEGNLRGRFTSNVGKVTAPAEELRQNLQAAPSNQLLLAAVHLTRDTSLLDLYEDQVVGTR